MSRSTIDPRDHRGILTSRRNGATIEDIAEAFDYPPAVVASFIRTNTRPTPPPPAMPKGTAGSSTGQRTTVRVTEPAPAPPEPTPAPVDTLEQLLNRASTPKAHRLAEKAKAAVAALQAQVDADHTAAAEKKKAEQEKAAAKAEIARLQAELDAARKKAGLTRTPRRGAGTGPTALDAGADARTIRTWATTNNIPVPVKGRLPQAVIDAYQAATTKAGAA